MKLLRNDAKNTQCYILSVYVEIGNNTQTVFVMGLSRIEKWVEMIQQIYLIQSQTLLINHDSNSDTTIAGESE